MAGPPAQSMIALYTQLHAECQQQSSAQTPLVRFVVDLHYNLLYSKYTRKKSNQWSLNHTAHAMHVCQQPITARSAVHTRPPTVAVHITLIDGWCNRGKIFEVHRVWDKVPEGSTLIFGHNLIFLKQSIAQAKENRYTKSARSVQLFQYNTGMWWTHTETDKTHGHTTTANARTSIASCW